MKGVVGRWGGGWRVKKRSEARSGERRGETRTAKVHNLQTLEAKRITKIVFQFKMVVFMAD